MTTPDPRPILTDAEHAHYLAGVDALAHPDAEHPDPDAEGVDAIALAVVVARSEGTWTAREVGTLRDALRERVEAAHDRAEAAEAEAVAEREAVAALRD